MPTRSSSTSGTSCRCGRTIAITAALHRALVRPDVERFTAAFFLNPPYSADYAPLPSVIDCRASGALSGDQLGRVPVSSYGGRLRERGRVRPDQSVSALSEASMAFIDILPTSSISDEVRAMYARQEAHWGFVPNYAKVFCHRPEIMGLWAQLQVGIKRHMTKRRFELITFVSATALRSTLCSLAHGRALMEFIPEEDVLAHCARRSAARSISAAEAGDGGVRSQGCD